MEWTTKIIGTCVIELACFNKPSKYPFTQQKQSRKGFAFVGGRLTYLSNVQRLNLLVVSKFHLQQEILCEIGYAENIFCRRREVGIVAERQNSGISKAWFQRQPLLWPEQRQIPVP